MKTIFAAACILAATGASAAQRGVADLANPNPDARLRAVQELKASALPESALPLAKLVSDPVDDIQFEAIGAELNIFLAEKVVPRRRIGFLIEVRSRIAAQAAFESGPLALGPAPVPMEVLTALRGAARDDNPRVAIEALYALGALGVEPGGASRRELLQSSSPVLAAMLGVGDIEFRAAAVRVIGRLFEQRAQDDPVDESLGDAVIGALNDSERGVRLAAMEALGAMRYARAVQALGDMHQYYGKGELAEASLDALARIGHVSSAPLMRAALAAKSSALRRIGIEGLARSGDRTAFADIQAAVATDGTDAVRLAGAFAAVLLAGAPIDPLGDALLKNRVHDQAWRYLVEAVPGRTAALTRAAQDPDARLRLDAANILGLAGDPAALPIVEKMTQDRDAAVAAAATRAVARLRATQPRA